jgi:hypothetical protein
MQKIAILLLLLIVIFSSYFALKKFIKVDRCLDSGGRFNNEQDVCER